MNIRYKAAIEELYRVYNLALDYFNLQQEVRDSKVIITIQSKGNKKALGWFCPNSWEDDGEIRSEINLSAETLDLPAEDIIQILMHECQHLINFTNGRVDVRPNSQYHNKVFKQSCSEMGLIAESMPPFGYALTKFNEQGLEFFNSCNVNPEAFKIKRITFEKEKKESDYLAVTLKKELWEDRLNSIKEEKDFKNIKEVVEFLLAEKLGIDLKEEKALLAKD